MSEWDETKILAKLGEITVRQGEIERKLDEVLEFTAATTEVVAPFLSGKGSKWLALVAKSRRSA